MATEIVTGMTEHGLVEWVPYAKKRLARDNISFIAVYKQWVQHGHVYTGVIQRNAACHASLLAEGIREAHWTHLPFFRKQELVAVYQYALCPAGYENLAQSFTSWLVHSSFLSPVLSVERDGLMRIDFSHANKRVPRIACITSRFLDEISSQGSKAAEHLLKQGHPWPVVMAMSSFAGLSSDPVKLLPLSPNNHHMPWNRATMTAETWRGWLEQDYTVDLTAPTPISSGVFVFFGGGRTATPFFQALNKKIATAPANPFHPQPPKEKESCPYKKLDELTDWFIKKVTT